MGKKLLIVLVILILLGAGIFAAFTFANNSSNQSANQSQNGETNQTDSPFAQAPEPTQLVFEEYSSELADITEGQTLADSVSTEGNAVGYVDVYFDEVNGEYLLFADVENVPVLINEDYYYEGWIERPATPSLPASVVSTGVLKLNDDNTFYENEFSAFEDYRDHTIYVVTLEAADGNPEQAQRILEGSIQ